MRMKRKPNLASRIEKCSHLLVAQPEALRGRWQSEFGYGELRLELGCGKGLFTVETAKAEPEVFFAAFEKTENVLVSALERADREGLQNVKFVSAFVSDLAEYFAQGELARIYLNFCDPWPSNRHAKRRLTSRSYLEQYARALQPGGEVHFKTDNLPFYEFSLRESEGSGFKISEDIRDLHKDGPVGVMTDYELKFYSQNAPVFRCVLKM